MDPGAPFPHYGEWQDLLGEAVELFGQRRVVAMVNAWRRGYEDGANEWLGDEHEADPPGARGNRNAPLRRLYRRGFRQRRMELASPYWRQPPP